MKKPTKKTEILDCSIRDGGYINNWRFESELVRESYRALSKSGVDYVEVGFRSSERHFDRADYGRWKFSTEEDLQKVTENIKGARIAVMGDYGKIAPDDLIDRKNSCIDLVRVAVHKNNVFSAIDLLEKIKAKGYQVSLQCMAYNSYDDQERKNLHNVLGQTALDYVYVGDSYGSIFPFQIEQLFEPFIGLGTSKVGFHPHNNIQMSFANTLEAIRIGVDIVDTTIYGIGRGAGNLPTEILLSYFIAQGNGDYNVIPILNCIERYYLDLMKESPWGYQLPYMISGIFESHPSYSKELMRRMEYSMEDIWKSLEYIRKINPLGYDKSIIDNLIQKGFLDAGKNRQAGGAKRSVTSIPREQPVDAVPYVNRYPDREFLVLANGPSLKKNRKEISRFIDKYKPVTLGANFLGGLFEPDYHAFNNKKRFMSHVSSASPGSRLLLGSNIPVEMIKEYVTREYETLHFRDVLEADFDIQNGVIMANCRTISVLLAGVAVVMGAKRIFLAGMDGYLHKDSVNGSLFYDEKFDPQEHQLNVERHNWNEKFLNQIDAYIRQMGGEGIHIITPTSHQTFYKSITNYIPK